jgi:iron-sulfur cluster assembly protein
VTVADVSGGKLFGIGAKPPQPAAPVPTPVPEAPAPAPRRSGIEIAESAAVRIHGLLEGRGTPGAGLRIRVKGGGCTGLQYDMEFAEGAREKDRTFEAHGVKIFVDPKSYIFLVGTVLTYHQGKLESGFKLENPNVKQSCGCGESFTI